MVDSQQMHPSDENAAPANHTQAHPILNDTTASFSRELAAQLVAIDGDISDEEAEAITALPSGSALLIVRRGPNSGARFLLDADVAIAGRHPDAEIFLDDVTVSRRHAEFARHGTSFQVKDLGSLNGTYYDGVHKTSNTLGLTYGPDEVYQLPAELLRTHSPSAEVQGHGKPILQFGKLNVRLTKIEPAGQYALKLTFDDGHDSGLFTWDYLYQLAVLKAAGKTRDPSQSVVRLML